MLANLFVTFILLSLAAVTGGRLSTSKTELEIYQTPLVIDYDRGTLQGNPPGCDLYLKGDAFGKTWIGGCTTNYCNPGVEDCQLISIGAGQTCECSLGLAQCYSVAILNAQNQVTGVICVPNGCGWDCDLVLWTMGNFHACWC